MNNPERQKTMGTWNRTTETKTEKTKKRGKQHEFLKNNR